MSNSRQIASLPNILTLIDDAGGQFIKQQAAGVTTSYTITWPSALGASGSVLGFTDGSGSLGWLTSAPKATILNTGRDFTFTGDATGSISGFDGSANVSTALTLAASGVSAGSYGGSTAIPVITIDAKGRITSASTAAISSSLTIAADSGSNDTVTIGSDTLTFAGTSNEVDTTVSNNQIQIGLPSNVTVANNLTVSGNLTVTGTTTQTGSVVSDSNFTGLSDANTGNATDFGFYGKYVESSTTKYAGIFYDASTDNTFRLFADTQTVPSTTVNTGATGYAAANLIAGTITATTFSGALSGTVASATTGTTQAASDNSTKLATTAYVTTAVSNLVDSAPGALNTLNELAAALGDDANFSTTVTNSIATKLPLAGGTLTGNVIFSDNVKALFGTGSDLEIYHDGSNSYLVDAGTGGILYRGGTQTFQNAAGSKTMAVLNGATSVDLYYDNSKKFETTSGGIAVTGTATATTFSATTLTGTLSTAAQPNVTSVGTLSSLTVSGALNATLSTAAQTNITSLGTLTSLNVNGTATATAFSGPLTGNVTGNVSGSAATVTGAAQTNITSLGTLSTLTVSGDVTIDTSTLKVDSSNNRIGILNASPDVTLDIGSATDSIHIPVGTTAQRPGSPAAGYFRYNSSLNQFEGYTSAWGAIGGGGTNTFTHNVFTGDGSTTAFTLSAATESENNLLVFIDGVFQEQGAYSIATSGGTTTLTMSAAPASGRKLVVYQVSAAVSGNNLNIDTMTGDGSDTTLTLSLAPVNENNTQVFFDGVYQNKSTYSISGTTLTFSTAPPTGVAVEVMTFTQTEVNVPVNDTIDTVHIKAGAVTAAKIESSLDLSSKSLTLPAVAVPSASTATTQAASDNTTKIATTAYVTTAIANLIDGAPGTLNTLNELAAALADDASFSSTITTSLAAKANLAAPNFTGNVTFDTSTLVVDATNNRVGIGTTTPTTILELKSASATAGLSITGGNSNTSDINLGDTDDINIQRIRSDHSDNSLQFFTNNAERVRIDSSGNVGIGTTSPGYPLEVQSGGSTVFRAGTSFFSVDATGSASSPSLVFNGDTNTGFYRSASDTIKFASGGSDVVTLGSTVDIAAKLSLNDSTYGGWIQSNTSVRIDIDNDNNQTDRAFIVSKNNANSNLFIVKEDGNVGIGTSSPNTNLQLYHATDDISINVNHGTGGSYPKKSGISFGATSTSLGGDATFTGGAGIQVTNTAASNNPTEMGFFTTSGGAPTVRMLIDSSGDVIVGGTSSGANDAVSISNTGYIQAIVNGDTVGYFNRRTSDGEIIRVQKDGSTVGSIGSNSAGGVPTFDFSSNSSSGIIRLLTSGSEAVRLDNNGKLLHGISTVPTGVLLGNQFVSSSATGSEIIAFRADTSVSVGDKIGAFLFGNSDTDGVEDHFVGMYGKVASTNGAANLHFVAGRAGYENDSSDMTILSGGKVVIGGTTAQGGGLLTLEGPDADMLVLHRTADTGDQAIKFMDHGDLNAVITGRNGGHLTFQTGANNFAMHLVNTGEARFGSETVARQSIAAVNSRKNGAAIEFGHQNNSAGYFGTIGAFGNNGMPYIGFSCSSELAANTFSTFGHKGNIIRGNLSGDLHFMKLGTANATGQTPERVAAINANGTFHVNWTGSADTSGYFYAGQDFSAANHRINRAVSQGGVVLVVSGYSGSSADSALFYGVSNGGSNTNAAAIRCGKNTSTNRSINAAGTINASGSDYAEYMEKKSTAFEISAGDICGVNEDGKLTNKFSEAHSFVVKSTDPSYVGGDIWGSEDILGKKPLLTTQRIVETNEDLEAGETGDEVSETDEEYAVRVAQYETDLAAYEAVVEAERIKYDRIAFSGQVPVNVTGAAVGDYIIPKEATSDSIIGEAVSSPSFEQYQLAVGKVWKILDDGRAFISVKIG